MGFPTGNDIMKIRYSSGFSFEGTLLSRTEHSMRVLTPRSEDVREFTATKNGVWISEDGEPVQVDFEFVSNTYPSETTEEDCICSQELVANLIQILFAPNNEPEVVPARVAMTRPVCPQVA